MLVLRFGLLSYWRALLLWCFSLCILRLILRIALFMIFVMMVAVVMIFALMSSVCIVALVLGLVLRFLLGLVLRT